MKIEFLTIDSSQRSLTTLKINSEKFNGSLLELDFLGDSLLPNWFDVLFTRQLIQKVDNFFDELTIF